MKKAIAFLMAAGMTLSLSASAFAEEDPTRIALLLPYIGDQSYFDVTARGLDLVNEEYGDAVQTQLAGRQQTVRQLRRDMTSSSPVTSSMKVLCLQ